jgi:hypothetical protein
VATGTGKIRFTENNIFEKHSTKRNRIFHQLFALVALSASYQTLHYTSCLIRAATSKLREMSSKDIVKLYLIVLRFVR